MCVCGTLNIGPLTAHVYEVITVLVVIKILLVAMKILLVVIKILLVAMKILLVVIKRIPIIT